MCYLWRWREKLVCSLDGSYKKPCLPLTLLTYFILEGRSYQKNPDKVLEKSQPGRTPSLFIQVKALLSFWFSRKLSANQ